MIRNVTGSQLDIVGIEGTQVVLPPENASSETETFPASALEKFRHRTNLIGNADEAQLYAFAKTDSQHAGRGE